MTTSAKFRDGFRLAPGRVLAGKYVVGEQLGKGWEGEVYHVTEVGTGVERAAKFFFPQRNPDNRAVLFYAKKLDKLRTCPIVIQYHTQEAFRYKGERITFLISDYVEGQLLSEFVASQPGKRLHWFEALHLVYALAKGVEPIHRLRDYHGDLHADNIIVNRAGIGFDVKLVDMFEWGKATREHLLDDVCYIARILYDAVGGVKHYKKQPQVVKDVCCGLKRSLIAKKFRNAGELRVWLETIDW